MRWHRATIWLAVAAASLAAAACGGSAASSSARSPATSLTLKPCLVDAFSARCGTLVVPENRLTGKGRTIPVRVVVFPATGSPRQPDPVVYFAGGPGGSSVDDIPGELQDLVSLNTHRDLVFVEQRGTGQANPLSCPAFPSLADKAALRASVESCLAHLNGDLRYYTTMMYVEDVAQVLTDLHYAKVNLMGISYGTMVEQVFALRYPGWVRTMTLQSGSPLNMEVFEHVPGNTQLALDYVFASCEAQPACHRAFPRLAADWASLWSALKTPWVVPAAQSPTKTAMTLTSDYVEAFIYQLLFTGDTGPIPLIVHTLGAAKNREAAMLALTSAGKQGGLSLPNSNTAQMLLYEVECSEPWDAESPAALAGQRDSYAYADDYAGAQWMQYVCSLIPKSAGAVGSVRLTRTGTPLLAFNGAADPIEQPRNMDAAPALWPNSREITLPGQGHDVNSAIWGLCAGPLTETFIDQASVAHLNTSCLAAIPATAFDLTLRDLASGGG
jgi:pimeloyl-ACP methyl ester carboxylesterase